MKKTYFVFVAIIASFTILFAIELNQWDNFQDGTTQGWQTGAPNPNPPVVVTDGGPEGAGDAYLLLTSSGSTGAGGRLIVFNSAQWTGDYTGAGVEMISMHMNNFGSVELSMRIVLQGPGDNFWSVNPVLVPPQSGWVTVQFPVQAGDLTGGSDVSATLGGVTRVRILHSVSGSYIADRVTAQLGIDNITAAHEPLPVEFISFSAVANGSAVNLSWTTASETNNLGFEIQRKIKEDHKWLTKGFVKGEGTSAEKHSYSFIDDNVLPGNYSYRLKQVDYSGIYSYSDIIEVNVELSQFYLSQNYPNPFNPVTKIKYSLLQTGYVTLKVYNTIGEEVVTLVNNIEEAGSHQVGFDASDFNSGVYYYRLESGNFSVTNKMILIK
jgi:hypothetical protein